MAEKRLALMNYFFCYFRSYNSNLKFKLCFTCFKKEGYVVKAESVIEQGFTKGNKTLKEPLYYICYNSF